jgi:RIO-like serine/threonine protein kinase
MTRQVCEKCYIEAFNAALKRMKWYVTYMGMLHQDVNVSNALFNKYLGDVELVDWGTWVERNVRRKPTVAFLSRD